MRGRSFGAALRAIGNGILRPAEDPRVRFALPYVRQQQLLAKVRRMIAETAAATERLATQTDAIRDKVRVLEQRGPSPSDGVARLAARRRDIAAAELEEIEMHRRSLEVEEGRLVLIEQRLLTEVEALRAREHVIDAGHVAAEAQVRIRETLAGASSETGDLADALEDAERRMEHMRARASAIDELIRAGVLDEVGAER